MIVYKILLFILRKNINCFLNDIKFDNSLLEKVEDEILVQKDKFIWCSKTLEKYKEKS